MNRPSTFVLRTAIILIGLAVLAVCVLILPRLIFVELQGDFDYAPILIGVMLSAIPFFLGLERGLRFLGFVDNGKAFSTNSVDALRRIKNCAYTVSAIYALGLPYIFYVADRDDAPGLVAMGIMLAFVSFVIATACALFQRLVQAALDIKSENDLTV